MTEVEQKFTAVLQVGPKQRVFVPLPFVPDETWGVKSDHHVAGTINSMPVRAVVERLGSGHGIVVGPTWRRDCGITVGEEVAVVLSPEGPQRDDLAEDFRSALESRPDAAAFFDSLAQFYRNAYLRWIDATKRRPDERTARISEVIQLLADRVKQRR
jgi:Bacteriocin-protection, YdeI or OmpD-Associated/Domain of unknown function (DUF1905)